MPPTDDDDLRSDLVALAVADPAAVAAVVLACIRRHASLAPLVRRVVAGALPTRPSTDHLGREPPAQATAQQVRVVAAACHAMEASADVRHRAPVAVGDALADLSVRRGEPAVILGGNVVALRAVAALAAALGDPVDDALARISDAIVHQLGGRVSHRTLARVRSPTPRPAAPPEEDDAAVRCLQVVMAFWPPSAGMRRGRGEDSRSYLARLLALVRAAADAGDAAAQETLASVEQEFPALL